MGQRQFVAAVQHGWELSEAAAARNSKEEVAAAKKSGASLVGCALGFLP